MISNPIFLVGTERSGSNLLRAMLNAHANIAIPHPPHLFKELHPLLGYYGDLNIDGNFRQLIQDAAKLVDLHFAPWPIQIDEELVFRNAKQRDLYCVYAEIYEQYLTHAGKKRWGCKSTFMIHHVDEILKHHSSPRIIHLVRDGRDVAVSAKSSIFNHYHPFYVAQLWSKQQRVGMALAKKLTPELFLTVRYEDLVSDPQKEVKRVCAFLNEEYSERLLEFFKGESASELSSLSGSWKNLANPVMKENFGKFRTALSPEEVLEFERIAYQELRHFGYELVNEPARLSEPRPLVEESLSQMRFFLEEKKRMLRVQGSALLEDKNSWLRLRKRAFVELLKWKGRLRREPPSK